MLSCVLSQHLAGSDIQSMASRCSFPQLVDHEVPFCSSPCVSRSQSSCVPPSSQDRRGHTENASQRYVWWNVTSLSCTEPSSSRLSSVGGAWIVSHVQMGFESRRHRRGNWSVLGILLRLFQLQSQYSVLGQFPSRWTGLEPVVSWSPLWLQEPTVNF